MNSINLRDQVQRAIAQQWPAFAAAHPRLAEELDQSLLVQSTLESLANDPQFQAAMEQAAQAGGAGEAILATIAQLVQKYLRALV